MKIRLETPRLLQFLQRFWEKGYATESAFAMRDYAFDTLELNTLYSFADIKNKESRYILEKVGMRPGNEFEFDGGMHIWHEMNQKE